MQRGQEERPSEIRTSQGQSRPPDILVGKRNKARSHLCSANPSNLGTVPARRKRKPPHSQENAFENTHCSGSSVNSVDLASQCMSGQDKRNQNGLFKRTLVSNCSSLPEESCKAPQTLNTSADLRGSFFFKKYSGSVWWGHMGRL